MNLCRNTATNFVSSAVINAGSHTPESNTERSTLKRKAKKGTEEERDYTEAR
jgi:hypothetical protein